ncbi:hypothetical protein M9Y10_007242 [Tritrichomonas musculus]|uniref:Surface antigen BspA-like protein n=1 Tax=Tritrichomonas musculus TaxID=1915356 RepID=A0ABR2J0S4_9EUKA
MITKQSKDEIDTVTIGGIQYVFNKKEKTASIKKNIFFNKVLVVPQSIMHDNQEYIITKIMKDSFLYQKYPKTIEFSTNSKVSIFEKLAFQYSGLESLSIPSSVIDMQKGWCGYSWNLTKINVMPNNPRYKLYENKYIIGKTSIEQENFDILVFSVRDIKVAKIPNFIEIIDQYAFSGCKYLSKVEIESDSKLRIIDENAFSFSAIKSIIFPSKLTHIGESAFESCKLLNRIEFRKDSELQFIGDCAFKETSIEKITIPVQLKIINSYAFYNCSNLHKFVITEKSKLEILGKEAFSNTSIKSFYIPNHVMKIEDCAFSFCDFLQIVEFDENVNLKYSDLDIFDDCSDTIIMIPIKLGKHFFE